MFVDVIKACIEVAKAVIAKRESICVMKAECESFLQASKAVVNVLEDIIETLISCQSDVIQQDTSLSKLEGPVEAINTAIKQGSEIVDLCTNREKLKARMFSAAFTSRLEVAGYAMDRGLQLLIAAAGNVQKLQTQIGLEDLTSKVTAAHGAITSMQVTLAHRDDQLLEALRDQFSLNQKSLSDSIVQRLIEEGVVYSRNDCETQLQELQDDPSLRANKELYDKQLVELVKGLSLSTTDDVSLQRTDRDCLYNCSISLERMKDPVVLFPSGITYDRESICKALIINPRRCPLSGKEYDEKLQYVDNVTVRQELMNKFGDKAYERYEDRWFAVAYGTAWTRATLWARLPGSGQNPFVGKDSTYALIMAHLYGMNQEKVCIASAFSVCSNGLDEDPQDYTLAGFMALFLHPSTPYKSSEFVKDKEQAQLWWTKAKESGLESIDKGRSNEYALPVLAYGTEVLDENVEKALVYFHAGMDTGAAMAQNDLGFMHFTGRNVQQDDKKACKYFQLAADQGHATAQSQLGYMYEYGRGVVQDAKKACECYQLAADQGDAAASNKLNWMYAHGRGLQENEKHLDYAVPSLLFYQATRSFDGDAFDNQLSFDRGAIIEIRNLKQKNGWGYGMLRGTNQEGWFPGSYVNPTTEDVSRCINRHRSGDHIDGARPIRRSPLDTDPFRPARTLYRGSDKRDNVIRPVSPGPITPNAVAQGWDSNGHDGFDGPPMRGDADVCMHMVVAPTGPVTLSSRAMPDAPQRIDHHPPSPRKEKLGAGLRKKVANRTRRVLKRGASSVGRKEKSEC